MHSIGPFKRYSGLDRPDREGLGDSNSVVFPQSRYKRPGDEVTT